MSTDTVIPDRVGAAIRAIRQGKNMRQQVLAQLTGIRQPNISRIENELVRPRNGTMKKILEALDVTYDQLMGMKSAALTSAQKLEDVCRRMEKLHGWEPMIEIWFDKFGVQRIEMQYSLPTDEQDAPLRSWCTVDDIDQAARNFDVLVDRFVARCTAGLDEEKK